MEHLRPRWIPDNDLRIRAGFTGLAHQARLHIDEVITNDAALVIRTRVAIQAIGNGAIDIDEGIAFCERVRGMVPHQYCGVPEICCWIWSVEILEEIATDDPVIGSVDAHTIRITNTSAMIGRWWSSRVLDDRIFDQAIVHPSCRAIRIRLDELRSGVQKFHTVDMRRLGAGIKDDWVVIGIADRWMGNGRVQGIRPNAEQDTARVSIIHAASN